MAVSVISDSKASHSTTTVVKGSDIATGTTDSNSCTRVGNIVTASGRIHTMTNQDAGEHTYFVIPDGYRPKSQVRGFGFMSIDGTGFVPLLATINTNGTVQLAYSSSKQCNQVGFAVTYAI